MKINWKIRFTKHNLLFLSRFIFALLVPVITYLNIEAKDITSWDILGEILVNCVTNPYLLGLMIINGINLIPDPTTEGLGDSTQALAYEKPNENRKEGNTL